MLGRSSPIIPENADFETPDRVKRPIQPLIVCFGSVNDDYVWLQHCAAVSLSDAMVTPTGRLSSIPVAPPRLHIDTLARDRRCLAAVLHLYQRHTSQPDCHLREFEIQIQIRW